MNGSYSLKSVRAGLGVPDPEEHWGRREFRHRFLGLALEAYRRERISRSRLVELGRLVNLSREAVERLIDESRTRETRSRWLVRLFGHRG
jgi:hypothetical protein